LLGVRYRFRDIMPRCVFREMTKFGARATE
jgi:hypothetical protein